MKKLAGIFMLLCLTFSLTACGGKLSEEFEETEVKEAAEEIVNLINEGKLSEVYEDSFIPVLRNWKSFRKPWTMCWINWENFRILKKCR